MQTTRLGSLEVTRFILGGNPFSGFSHQSVDVDKRMVSYFTTERIKRTLRNAESLGIKTLVARADNHVIRILTEYWNEGGSIQWIAQTCPEFVSTERSLQSAINGGARACYIHGGVMDHLFAHNQLDEVPPALDMIRSAGMPAGIAAHNPEVHRWAERELAVDFHMCSYYNPFSREASPEKLGGFGEDYDDQDRQAMVETIATLSKPAIHYKVLAAGRSDPADAFRFVARHLRQLDAVCVGIFDEDNPSMLKEDVSIFEQSLVDSSRT